MMDTRAVRRILRIGLAAAVIVVAAPSLRAQEPSGTIHPLSWPQARSPIVVTPQSAELVERALAAMTLEEKIGQLLQADIGSVTPDDVRLYHLGSVLAGGNAAPGSELRTTARRWQEMIERYRAASLADGRAGRPPVPILFGIDGVHGNGRVVGATVFPHNVGLGATHDPQLVEEIGRATAQEVAAIGADWTFAPVVAVVRDPRWGRTYESFSEDPQLVASYARAAVLGLQGHPGTTDFMSSRHVLASVKHFMGDGSTLDGRDQFDSRIDEATLREVHAAGYTAGIRAGALNVMASYNGWQGTKMHVNKALLTQVLKERWGFPGFVVGDWNAQEEIPGCTKYDCPQLLNAGIDMYMAPDSWKKMYANLLAAARDQRIAAPRIDDAVRRILRVKALMHLLGEGTRRWQPESAGLAELGSAAHRALARRAVRESLVLLKNNHGTLPLDPHQTVLVTGASADSIGDQCGGWTIDWQADHNSNADFPGGSSVYAAIRAAVEAAGGRAVLSADGSFGTHPDVAIVVFGEPPYAEFQGDRETLEFAAANAPHLKILRHLREAGVPIVSVFLSGRPLWINRELNLSDALVAAWLPGSEGGGIADLLFRTSAGSPRHDFTGRLAFSWPALAMPVSFAADGSVRGALFERGYGLGLASRREIGALPEDPGVGAARSPQESLFGDGHAIAPWSVFVEDSTAPVRLTTQSQATPRGVLSVARESAGLTARWSGGGVAELRIGGRAQDFTSRAGEVLHLRYQLLDRPSGRVTLGVRCEAPYGTHAPTDPTAPRINWGRCGAAAGVGVDVSHALSAVEPGSWQELSVPFKCMLPPGSDLAHLNAPFALVSGGRLALRIAEVRLEPGTAPCPTDAPAPGMIDLPSDPP